MYRNKMAMFENHFIFYVKLKLNQKKVLAKNSKRRVSISQSVLVTFFYLNEIFNL